MAAAPKVSEPTYTEAADRVVYGGEGCNHMSERDFIDLALAALDQGGTSVNLQNQIKSMLENAGLMDEEPS